MRTSSTVSQSGSAYMEIETDGIASCSSYRHHHHGHHGIPRFLSLRKMQLSDKFYEFNEEKQRVLIFQLLGGLKKTSPHFIEQLQDANN